MNERIHTGLIEAIDDGTFDSFFNERVMSKGLIERFDVPHRRIVALKNPLLTKETQALVDNKNLWLDLSKYCLLENGCILSDQ